MRPSVSRSSGVKLNAIVIADLTASDLKGSTKDWKRRAGNGVTVAAPSPADWTLEVRWDWQFYQCCLGFDMFGAGPAKGVAISSAFCLPFEPVGRGTIAHKETPVATTGSRTRAVRGRTRTGCSGRARKTRSWGLRFLGDVGDLLN